MFLLLERIVITQSLILQCKLCKFLQALPVDLVYLDSAASVLPISLGLEVLAKGSD